MLHPRQVEKALGLESPFSKVHFASHESAVVADIVEATVADNDLLVVAGPRGAGKTRAVLASLPKGCKAVQIDPQVVDKLHIGSIQEALIDALGEGETPRRSRHARASQTRRILGEASAKGKIALVIDDAQEAAGSTWSAIKRLREVSFAGKAPLLSVILIAQRDPLTAPGLDAVRLRSSGTLWLGGLSESEAVEYIRQTVGQAFEESAIRAAAETDDRSYLGLQATLRAAMQNAVSGNRKMVSALDVYYATGGGSGLKAVLESKGITQAELSRKANVSATELNRYLSGERKSGATTAKVTAALHELLDGGAGQVAEQAPRLRAAGGGVSHEPSGQILK